MKMTQSRSKSQTSIIYPASTKKRKPLAQPSGPQITPQISKKTVDNLFLLIKVQHYPNLSQQSRHLFLNEKTSLSLVMINKAKIHIQNIQVQILKQIESSTNQTQKESLASKRFYGLYMKMIIYYNVGAENEHLNLKSEALEYYKQSKQIAIIINNQLMVEKLQGIIGSIIKKA